jgi:Domain of unknown function (DUF5666)
MGVSSNEKEKEMNQMKRQRITSLLIAAAVAVLAFGALVGSGAAKSRSGDDDGNGRSFHGTVDAVFAKQRAFTVDRTSGSTMRFVVRPSTTYEHINGFSGIKKGVPVEVHAINPNGRWIATRVETNPGGSGGGGSDDPPGDDNGGERNGSDDPPGDDHGSGGHGSDD